MATKVELIKELHNIRIISENVSATHSFMWQTLHWNGATMKPVCDIDWHYNIPDITNVYKTFFELVFLPESRDEMNFAVLCCTFLNFRETIPVLKLHDGNVTVIEPLHYSGSPTDDEPTGTGEGAYNPGAQDTFTVLKKMVQSDPNISSQFKSAMGL